MLDELRVQPLDEALRPAAFVHECAHHRQQQRHQQRGRTSPYRQHRRARAAPGRPAAAECRRITAHGVGRTGHAERFKAGCLKCRSREHRLLNLASDLEVVLQRQSIRDFQHDQQVHEQKPEEQPDGPGREGGMRDQEQVDALEGSMRPMTVATGATP